MQKKAEYCVNKYLKTEEYQHKKKRCLFNTALLNFNKIPPNFIVMISITKKPNFSSTAALFSFCCLKPSTNGNILSINGSSIPSSDPAKYHSRSIKQYDYGNECDR